MTKSKSAQGDVYLGKDGKTFGPFSSQEYSSLVETGKLHDYAYIWKEDQNAWAPLELPPPPLDLSHSEKSASPSGGAFKAKELWAYCHNFSDVIRGVLTKPTEMGCDLIVTNSGDHPRFAVGSDLLLNLQDTAAGISVNVKAKLIHVVRDENHWTYRLRWEEVPVIFQSSPQA